MNWSVDYHPLAFAEVEDWPADLRSSLQRVIERIKAVGLEHAGAKTTKPIDGKLWEIRVTGKSGIARALYVTRSGRRLTIVLGFVKKTQKTPQGLIYTAFRRAKEV